MSYYIAMDRYGNYDLAHHGILGQKWGVRRYQNKDGSWTAAGRERYGVDVDRANKEVLKRGRTASLDNEHIIPKGTKIYRTTSKASSDLGEGATYVSYLDVDRNHYKNGYIRQRDKSSAAYEHTYELKIDLKIPSKDTVKDSVLETIKKNPKLKTEIVNGWLDMVFPKGSWDRFEMSYDDYGYSEKKWQGVVDDALKNFGNMSNDQAFFYACQSFGVSKNARQKVIDSLKSQGYNAMPDFASIGGMNGWRKEGAEPLILFESSDLSSIRSSKISSKEEASAFKKDKKWTNSVNRRP